MAGEFSGEVILTQDLEASRAEVQPRQAEPQTKGEQDTKRGVPETTKNFREPKGFT